MAPRTLDPERMTLDELFEEIAYTTARLRLTLLASSPHFMAFEALDIEAKAVRDEVRRLAALLIAAEAAIEWSDQALDGSVGLLSTSILKITHNDRDDPSVSAVLQQREPERCGASHPRPRAHHRARLLLGAHVIGMPASAAQHRDGF